jgi:Domain of unknown function (DUF1835)
MLVVGTAHLLLSELIHAARIGTAEPRLRAGGRTPATSEMGRHDAQLAALVCYESAMERIVHVCNGDSTADTLSMADLPGEIRVWADALDVGPVLPVSDAEHYRVRGEYLATAGHRGDAEGNAKQLATYDREFDEAASAEELILWYEHDLFDQLALAASSNSRS